MSLRSRSLAATVVLILCILQLLRRGALLSHLPAGIALQIGAAVLMVWARLVFGLRSFHAGANPTEGGLVTTGPYRFWRHPIYAAVLLFVWTGVLTTTATPGTVALALVATLLIGLRIHAEETLLGSQFPDYARYAASTKRLVPFVLAIVAMVAMTAPAARAQGAPSTGARATTTRCCATDPAITEADLRSRIYGFSDDSMQGRLTGSAGGMKGTAYIAGELRRLGLEPAGEHGSYFQDVPFARQEFDSASTLTVADTVLRGGVDFFVQPKLGTSSIVGPLEAVYYGAALDTTTLLTPDRVRGKLLVMMGLTAPPPRFSELLASKGYQSYAQMVSTAAAVVTIVGPRLTPALIRANFPPTMRLGVLPDVTPNGGSTGLITQHAAEVLLGAPRASLVAGMSGKPIDARLMFNLTRLPGRNVIAVLRGRDARLRGSYVALGAHSDHIGVRETAVDHDSMRVFNAIVRPEGADTPNRSATAEESARIRATVDSLHAAHGARLDSIHNGADDDGSGSMGLLEIAEAFATGGQRPRRSLLFVWHVGEEQGMRGSRYFTDHPTVSLDSIVAELNIDMIGRGGTNDVTGQTKDGAMLHGRNEGYLQLVGSRRLSRELGDLIETVNTERHAGLRFDYALDADGHPQNIYCRSDHAMYARFGIPVTFFTTGGHADYHQVTDEAQYLRFDQYLRVSQFIHDVAARVADMDHRPRLDGPKPDPNAECRQ